MSNAAQSWAWKQQPEHASDKIVLVALADNAWEDGSNAWPSVRVLAGKSGFSERTVQRSLQRLVAAGYVSVQLEAQPKKSRPTTYRLDLSRPPESVSPPVTVTPAPSDVVTPPPGDMVTPPGDTDAPPLVTLSASPPVTVSPEPLKNPKEQPSGKELVAFRADVEIICTTLRDRMIGNGCKPPTITDAWRTSARLLLDKDNRAYDEVLYVLDWCQSDSFWQGNIHSLPTFREKYDRLRMQAQRQRASSTGSNIDGFRALIQKFESQRVGGPQ